MHTGRILIECTNTIFEIYVNNENEVSMLEIFMGNIRFVKSLGLNDIYNWCNRHGISYNTKFNYNKNYSLLKNIQSYFRYSAQKMKYQLGFSFV